MYLLNTNSGEEIGKKSLIILLLYDRRHQSHVVKGLNKGNHHHFFSKF